MIENYYDSIDHYDFKNQVDLEILSNTKRISVIILFFLLLCSSCREQPDLSEIQNLNNNKIFTFGHGGMGISHKFPTNSLESLYKCLSYHPTGTEIDVQLTKDSVLIAFHDKELENSTNLTSNIYEEDWSYIQNAIYNEPPLAEYQITSLKNFIENISNPKDFTYVFDCQIYKEDLTDEYISFFVNTLLEFIDEHDLAENIFIEFGEREFLEKIKTLRPELKLFIIGSSDYAINVAKELDLFGISASTNDLTKEQIQTLHDDGFRVALWSVNSKAKNREAIEKHPDFIQSDKIQDLVELLGE